MKDARAQLVRLLQKAYSGEKAAALAYRGHHQSAKKNEEREAIRKIEDEEWVHRDWVGKMLTELGAKPNGFREIFLGLIGKILGRLCWVSGWYLPMYFAGKLETKNVNEYTLAAFYAKKLGLNEMTLRLREMAATEKQHEDYFYGILARISKFKKSNSNETSTST